MELIRLDFFESHLSNTPSKWREEAEWRRANADWLRHSQRIAVQALLKMKEEHLTQKALAEKMVLPFFSLVLDI